MEYEKKYMEYKEMVDYHSGKCDYYKSRSKTMYMKHYRYYKYYSVKMVYYGKKCGYMKENYEEHPGHDQACDTHTHYKHYYHHHHIVKHHQYCDKKKC